MFQLMKIIQIDPKGPEKKAIAEAAEIIRSGGVVAHPTDTCYGLAADVGNEDAVRKVYAIKQIESDRPLSVMVASLEQAEEIGMFNDDAKRLAEKFFPGPLTLVVPRTPTNETIGIRIPDCKVSEALIEACNSPLTTTSANRTGHPNPFSAKDVVRYFENQDVQPDLLLDGGPIESNTASTVVKVIEKPQLLREGTLSWKSIVQALIEAK